MAPTLPTPDEQVDFAILTAIEVERRAVCTVLGFDDSHRVRRGTRTYWRGTVALRDGGHYDVVVAQPFDMANIDMAILTNDALHHWKPQAALLVGIAASVSQQVRLGDVVIGSDVYYYERGKETPAGKKPEPKIIPPDAGLWNTVCALPTWSERIECPRPDGTRDLPTTHMGVIASGERVIADEAVRDRIASRTTPQKCILSHRANWSAMLDTICRCLIETSCRTQRTFSANHCIQCSDFVSASSACCIPLSRTIVQR